MSKTAKGLVEYCKAQLGRPYWWGTFGQTASAGLLETKKAQYPGYYTASDFQRQFGQRVHDCVGLIKGYRWSDTPESTPRYAGSQDVAVAGLYDQCSRRGGIDTMPMLPGVCVFMEGMGHVGVYIGSGRVIEAMGHAYGVVKTQLSGRGWAYWGMPGWIDYLDATDVEADSGAEDSTLGQTVASVSTGAGAATKPTYEYNVKLGLLKQGMIDEQVKTVQRLLIARGISCGPDGADGEFGKNTVSAVIKFQQLVDILDDGEVGGETWGKLLKG